MTSRLPWPILLCLTSLSATVEVVVMVGVGAILYRKKFIAETHVRVLSVMVFQIFTPCMSGYRFASSVDWAMLKTCWVLLLLSVVNIVAANVVARITFLRVIWKDRIEGIRATVLQIAVTFNNAGSLPFVYVNALTKTGNLFTDSEAASDLAIAYISLYLFPVQIMFWSYGLLALKQPDEPATQIQEQPEEDTVEATDTYLESEQHENNEAIEEIEMLHHDLQEEEPAVEQAKSSITEWIKNKYATIRRDLPLSRVITPPTYGCLIGAAIALIPGAKGFFIINPPVVVASISHVAKLFGDAVFPLSMILLGANLMNTMEATAESEKVVDEEDKEEKAMRTSIVNRFIKHNNPLTVLAAIIARLIVMPIFGVLVTVALVYLNIVPRSNPVLLLVMMVEASTPTAINTSILCTLNGNTGIHQMCEILLYMYLTAPITLSLFTIGFLYLSCSFATGVCTI